MRNAGLHEALAGIKIARKNINNLKYADDTTLMAENKEELKNLLMNVKEESGKADLKLNIQKTKIMASGRSLHGKQMGKQWKQWDFTFLSSKITADGDCSHDIKRCLLLGRKAMTNIDSTLKKQRQCFANKGPSSQSDGFSRIHVWIWQLDYKVNLVLKNWCFWTAVLEKTHKSPLDCKEIQPVNPEGNQSWLFIGRTDAEAEAPILWPPDAENWLNGKNPDSGKDWRQEEKGMTEDEMVGWHHRLDGHQF